MRIRILSSVALFCGVVALAVIGAESMRPTTADAMDQDRARKAMLSGKVAPLNSAIMLINERYDGEIIEVELDEEDVDGQGKIFIYEIKVLSPGGQVSEFELNAKSLQILSIEGNPQKRQPKK
ncbi:MAG: PepSY domain-containing protein [Magnetovibrio sp.]|nr:PepSY domain-containing protein [Magnetovibrio sp.]